jgi:membrane-bound serine protease (ClpP class)
MGEFTGLVELLGALFRVFGLGESAIFPALGLLIVFFLLALPAALSAQSRRVATGRAGMVGERGVAATALAPSGRVYVHSEYWNATADEDVPEGARIEVVDVEGMSLHVRRVHQEV